MDSAPWVSNPWSWCYKYLALPVEWRRGRDSLFAVIFCDTFTWCSTLPPRGGHSHSALMSKTLFLHLLNKHVRGLLHDSRLQPIIRHRLSHTRHALLTPPPPASREALQMVQCESCGGHASLRKDKDNRLFFFYESWGVVASCWPRNEITGFRGRGRASGTLAFQCCLNIDCFLGENMDDSDPFMYIHWELNGWEARAKESWCMCAVW